jgi:hypothetical protein
MVDLESVWDWTVGSFPVDAVCGVHAARALELAVALGVECALPQPTSVLVLDVLKG